ncbi:IS3 family transposase [Mechercharimyces sp. CAU 1602]|uniref:IS3 family transposase n=1 Tax=Mechercharimyces sp. CAU 1602 TaxID=2973933 RepID=UPI002163133E|nr:IS3 family transposase [Mechercharimyces sp. CAU 1602]MCS1351508.1 IS3 family transposase [Mechercharimyces sp. CAU 1602]
MSSLIKEYRLGQGSLNHWVKQYREECRKSNANNGSIIGDKDVYDQLARLRKEKRGVRKGEPFFKKGSSILCEGNQKVMYSFIEEHAFEFGVRWLLKRFQLSPHAYYNNRKKRKASYYKRKEAVLGVIKDIYHRYQGKMGYRMIQQQLTYEGYRYSRLTVYKYMKELGLRSIVYKRKPPHLKGKPHKTFPNILNRDFSAKGSTSGGVPISPTFLYRMGECVTIAPSWI